MSDMGNWSNDRLIDEIKVFIEYSVASGEQQLAVQTVEEYSDNSIALQVIYDFYRRLPKLREEAVSNITRIVSRHDVYLLSVDTANHEYLYLYNVDEPVYIGEKKEGIGEIEVLNYFGYKSDEDFLKKSNGGKKGLPKTFCPACGVAEGEIHLLGCPVEICPWCDGQFTYCNCRFDQLGVDEIVEESDLDRLEIILNDKGRIPFSADQAPAYPSGGDDDMDE